MAPSRRTSPMLTCLCICTALLVACNIKHACFVVQHTSRKPHSVTQRTAFESGKVNVGVEIQGEAQAPPQPVLDCDDACVTAIYDCIEEGCSVDAIMKLDTQLAEDEKKIADSIQDLSALQKTSYSPENAGTIVWFENFLSRSGTLRGQLQALKGIQNSDFVSQMVKAAAMAFGGGRQTDYPKVGVSPYSESPP